MCTFNDMIGLLDELEDYKTPLPTQTHITWGSILFSIFFYEELDLITEK